LSRPLAAAGGDDGAIPDAVQSIDAESWEFALKLYGEPGIAEFCLFLQNECGVDVMMLLMATFAVVRRGTVLTLPDIADMNAACGEWRERIVLPLRALRTTLKSGPAPAPSDRTERLRSSIKAAELSAERLQNELLAHWLAKLPATSRATERADVAAVVQSLVDFASRKKRDQPIAAEQSVIEAIVDAALRVSA
jgi:uncharacterized protein (TIGR02444 family)